MRSVVGAVVANPFSIDGVVVAEKGPPAGGGLGGKLMVLGGS
jgi:hypothetical protein